MNDLLKFITCGSVDDGKSTLIGHILYDSKLLYADQARALELDSKVGSRGGAIDYSLLLDGLTEEREQGITIDVAYRYFTTDARSFIVADTPGHEEYTRNMAVGASFADLAVILVDASQGVLIQTKRHARICALMGIRYFVFAINKMDLVDYDQARFDAIAEDIQALSEELGLSHVTLIPVSATEGDNVTKKSANMPWYKGPTILGELENVDVAAEKETGFVLPVQRVCRPNHAFRGFQGQIASGRIQVGDTVVTLPSKEKAQVKSILVAGREADAAETGQPVTLCLTKEVDVSRGCVLVDDAAGLQVSSGVSAEILWMDDAPLTPGTGFFVKLGTKLIPGEVTAIDYKIDINTGAHEDAEGLKKNEIAAVTLRFADNVVVDTFAHHQNLGEFILIDRVTNATAACGVVTEVAKEAWKETTINPELRRLQKGQNAITVAFPLRREGITEGLIQDVEKRLYHAGRHTYLYKPNFEDAPNVVRHLNRAGIIVLLALDTDTVPTEKFAEIPGFLAGWEDKTALTAGAIADFILEQSDLDLAASAAYREPAILI
ncbi:sulfate adenylyltransferase subunit 1 [Pseudoramibacter porci]|uniref:sulfate adenylyltransferase n=1 Tax=Pseudoramibacter porci TaxID=2606631 RepID=A0A7X2NE48_9FIRM|nr:GTP-binding protein [Pseudoramibacter porci]MSS18897.1 sulfate adenylyltransferase [Pseudoramibacter porci]